MTIVISNYLNILYQKVIISFLLFQIILYLDLFSNLCVYQVPMGILNILDIVATHFKVLFINCSFCVTNCTIFSSLHKNWKFLIGLNNYKEKEKNTILVHLLYCFIGQHKIIGYFQAQYRKELTTQQ